MKQEERWDVVLYKQFLELPKIDATEVKGDTHEYNGHIRLNKHKVCSYEDPRFTWVICPVVGFQD